MINSSPYLLVSHHLIATNLCDEVKDTIRQTPLADNKIELIHLARMKPQVQKEKKASMVKEFP